MSSYNPNNADGYSEYDDTTTGYNSTMDDIDEDDGYGYGNETASGYEDTTSGGYEDSTQDYYDTSTQNYDTSTQDYDTSTMQDDTVNDSSRFNDYSQAGSSGAGETYDSNVPTEEDGYAEGTQQYNPDYDYDANWQDYDDDGTEATPLNPEVRQYDHFDREADFQDEYDSDEEEDATPSSFYGGREQYEYRKDEAEEEKRVKKVKKRNLRDATTGMKVVGALCCCCICIITILILVLVFLVFKDEVRDPNQKRPTPNGGRTNRPTPRPTYPIPPALRPALEGRPDVLSPWTRVTDEPTISAYPTNIFSNVPTDLPTGLPTPKPTLSMQPTRPVPPVIDLPAVADTYIYVDGFFQYEAYGTEQSLLVQNGLSEYYEFADAMALIQFDLKTLPTKAQMDEYTAQAMLRLSHLPVNEKFAGREPATISVRRLLSTPMRVETLHGGMVDAAPADSILGENTVTVDLNQPTVYLDVSDLLYPPTFNETGYDRKQLLLMLFNNSTEQGDPRWTELEWQDQAGDRFESVESGNGPMLSIAYVKKS